MIKMDVFTFCLSAELLNRETMLRKKGNPAFASLLSLQEGTRCSRDRLATGLKYETGDDPDVALCLCLYHSNKGTTRMSDRECQVFDSSYKLAENSGFVFRVERYLIFSLDKPYPTRA